MKRLIWIIPLGLTVSWIATMIRDASIEDYKQQAFMMKACVDAGGEWVMATWSPVKDCIRPKVQPWPQT